MSNLKARKREIAATRVKFGFWRIYILIRCEVWVVNHKRIYRLYKAEGLNLLTKKPSRGNHQQTEQSESR